MFSTLFDKIKLGVGIAMLLVILAGAWYINRLSNRVDQLLVDNSTLTQNIEKQQELITSLQKDVVDIQSANRELVQLTAQQTHEVNILRKKFSEHNLGQLADAKPLTIQKIINRGSANAIRCLELATGAKHTKQELDAVKPSEINRECPSLANPNYLGIKK